MVTIPTSLQPPTGTPFQTINKPTPTPSQDTKTEITQKTKGFTQTQINEAWEKAKGHFNRGKGTEYLYFMEREAQENPRINLVYQFVKGLIDKQRAGEISPATGKLATEQRLAYMKTKREILLNAELLNIPVEGKKLVDVAEKVSEYVTVDEQGNKYSKAPNQPNFPIAPTQGANTVTTIKPFVQRQKEFLKQSIDNQGLVQGTLSYMGEGVQTVFSRGQDRAVKKYGGKYDQQFESLIGSTSSVAPYFIPGAGEALLFASGTESAITRQKKEQQFIDSGMSKGTAKALSYGLPAFELLTGYYGLKGGAEKKLLEYELKGAKSSFVSKITPAEKGTENIQTIFTLESKKGKTLGTGYSEGFINEQIGLTTGKISVRKAPKLSFIKMPEAPKFEKSQGFISYFYKTGGGTAKGGRTVNPFEVTTIKELPSGTTSSITAFEGGGIKTGTTTSINQKLGPNTDLIFATTKNPTKRRIYKDRISNVFNSKYFDDIKGIIIKTPEDTSKIKGVFSSGKSNSKVLSKTKQENLLLGVQEQSKAIEQSLKDSISKVPGSNVLKPLISGFETTLSKGKETSNIIAPNQKNVFLPLEEVKPATGTAPLTFTGVQPIIKTTPEEKNTSKPITDFNNIFTPRPKDDTKSKTTPRTFTNPGSKTINKPASPNTIIDLTGGGERTPKEEKIPGIIGFGFDFDIFKGKKKKKLPIGPHKAEAFIKGQWKPVNKKIYTYEGARDIGASYVDKSPSARFRVVAAKLTKGMKLNKGTGYYQKNKRKFRGFDIVSGIPKKTPNQYIEKRPYRIDTPGEKKGLKRAKRRKENFSIFRL